MQMPCHVPVVFVQCASSLVCGGMVSGAPHKVRLGSSSGGMVSCAPHKVRLGSSGGGMASGAPQTNNIIL